jgi:hypothetical protein
MLTILRCPHTSAILRISGEGIDPVAVTELLGIAPTETGKGTEYGSWLLSSEGKLSSNTVQQHALWILDQFQKKADALQNYRRRNCNVEILCHCNPQQRGSIFSSGAIRRLGEFGFQLILTFGRS